MRIITRNGVLSIRLKSDLYTINPFWERKVKEHLNLNKGVFVDIGAHIGYHTITMARKLNKRGLVIAFEPDDENYKILMKNIELNKCKNVIPFKLALWKKRGRLKLYEPANEKRTDMRTLVPVETVHSENKIVKVSNLTKYAIVEADTLDHVLEKLKIRKVDLMKIDVEGAEAEILESSKKTLKGKPKIIFEVWNTNYLNKVRKILKPFSYKIKKLDNRNYFAY